jgi:hypothetical protein
MPILLANNLIHYFQDHAYKAGSDRDKHMSVIRVKCSSTSIDGIDCSLFMTSIVFS